MHTLFLTFMLAASGDAIYIKRFNTVTPQTLTAPQRVKLGNAVNWTFGSEVGGDLTPADLTAMWCSQPVVEQSGTGIYTCEAEERKESVTDAQLLDLELEHGKSIVGVEANGDNWNVVIQHKNGTLSPSGIYRHDLFTEDAFSKDFSFVIYYKCWRPDLLEPSIVVCEHHAITTENPSVWADDKATELVVMLLGKVP